MRARGHRHLALGLWGVLAVGGLALPPSVPAQEAEPPAVEAAPTTAPAPLPAGLSQLDFARLPIQHRGRLQPLDSFARAQLRALSGATQLGQASAVSWLAELLFEPAEAALRPVFRLDNQELVESLGLSPRLPPLYAFVEVAGALPAVRDELRRLRTAPPASLAPAEVALGELYGQILIYFEISRSLSMALPYFQIESVALAADLGLEAGRDYNYMQMLRSRVALERLATPLRQRVGRGGEGDAVGAMGGRLAAEVPGASSALSAPREGVAGVPQDAEETEVLRLDWALQRMGLDAFSEILRIVPPQWEGDAQLWSSPWGVIKSGRGGPASARQVKLLARLARSYRAGDATAWGEGTAELRAAVMEQLPSAISGRLDVEYRYQRLAPFQLSLALYLLAAAALAISARWGRRPLHRLAWVAALAAMAVHVGGLATRVWLLGRPPVGTLYESILFVALIGALLGLVLAWRRDDSTGLAVASLLGASLLLLAPYFAGNEALGVLVAVLNTNFWLATHVLTITTGYGCCLAAGAGAHIWLLRCALGRGAAPGADDPAARALLGLSLVASFFTIFGTILGGIWADQSWGRFWGWDPKENGALLIVLWLLFLLHSRIAGSMGAVGFAVGLVALNVVVALAWFGVNLLGIGLHSYGFTDTAALGLAAFCAAELLFGGVLYPLAHRRQTAQTAGGQTAWPRWRGRRRYS